MEEIFIGGNMRRARRAAGKTQEEVCDGICDPSTLSRIETGKQAPSRSVATAVLQRLGQPHDRYYTVLTSIEAEADDLRTKIDSCAVRFQQSLGSGKSQARLEALELLDRLETVTEAGDNVGRQYILAVRAALGEEAGPYDFETRRDMLLKAIRLTVPKFGPETLAGHLYSIDETKIIGQIAGTYSEAGQHEKAADIFNQLLTYVRGHFQDLTDPSRYLSSAMLDYARELCLMRRYKKALDIAESGRKMCLDYGYCKSLPGLLAVMAKCRCAMGELEQSRALYCQAYYLFKETGNASGSAYVEEEARERLGLEFPLQGVLA